MCTCAALLQLEVCMESLADLESFWQQIPQQEHKAWSQRAQVSLPACWLDQNYQALCIVGACTLAWLARHSLYPCVQVAWTTIHCGTITTHSCDVRALHSRAIHSSSRIDRLLTSSCRCLQHFLIDGSPKWDIYRTVAVLQNPTDTLQASTSLPLPAPDSTMATMDLGIQNATKMVSNLF